MSGRKVDGVVIGIGLNVHTRDFPEEVIARATSLALLTKRPLDRADVLADLLAALDRETTLVAGEVSGSCATARRVGRVAWGERGERARGGAWRSGSMTRGGSSSLEPVACEWRGRRGGPPDRGPAELRPAYLPVRAIVRRHARKP